MPVVLMVRTEAGEAGDGDNCTSWYNVGVNAGRAMFEIWFREKSVGAVVHSIDAQRFQWSA